MSEQKTPAVLADEAAEAIRSLNHATLSKRDGWQYPSDAYDVVGDLRRLVMMLPQALQQAGKFFDDLADNGHVGVDGSGRDRGITVPVMQARVAASLINAVALAQELYDQLKYAHAELSRATYTEGTWKDAPAPDPATRVAEWESLPGVTDTYPSTAISDNAEHVEDQDDEEPPVDGPALQLRVNDAVVLEGNFGEIRAAVAERVTEWLATDPDNLAMDAAILNHAFTAGDVITALDRHGEWWTLFGGQTPVRISVTKG